MLGILLHLYHNSYFRRGYPSLTQRMKRKATIKSNKKPSPVNGNLKRRKLLQRNILFFRIQKTDPTTYQHLCYKKQQVVNCRWSQSILKIASYHISTQYLNDGLWEMWLRTQHKTAFVDSK